MSLTNTCFILMKQWKLKFCIFMMRTITIVILIVIVGCDWSPVCVSSRSDPPPSCSHIISGTKLCRISLGLRTDGKWRRLWFAEFSWFSIRSNQSILLVHIPNFHHYIIIIWNIEVLYRARIYQTRYSRRWVKNSQKDMLLQCWILRPNSEAPYKGLQGATAH